MTGRFVIISSDPDLTSLLVASLAASGVRDEALLFDRYPTVAQLRSVVASQDVPIVTVIVGLTELARATRLIEDFSATHPDVLLVAADTSAVAERILEAMRAGASEFLAPPFHLLHLVRRFQQQRKAAAPLRQAGKLLCFMPARGGNGASTVAVHVADAIRRELVRQAKRNGHPPRKPLLADFDFHAGTLPFRLRLEPHFTLADAVTRSDVIDELWNKIACDWNGIAVLAPPPAGVKLAPKAIERLASLFTSATRLYPYVLVDLPTALYASCRDLLISSDALYLVSTPEIMALHLARRRVAELQELGLSNESIRLVLNRVGARRSVKSADAAEFVGVPVAAEIQNNFSAFNDACTNGTLVAPKSRTGRQIQALAHSIMGVREDPATKSAPRRWRVFLAFE